MENNNKFELFWPKIINIWERKGKLADIVVSVFNPNSKKFELKIFSNCEILNIQNLNLVKYKCPLSKRDWIKIPGKEEYIKYLIF